MSEAAVEPFSIFPMHQSQNQRVPNARSFYFFYIQAYAATLE
jgi:hypothetical protein